MCAHHPAVSVIVLSIVEPGLSNFIRLTNPRPCVQLAAYAIHESSVVEGGPEFRVLAVNDLGDGNHASPAVARNRLFLVGLKNLYCLGSK